MKDTIHSMSDTDLNKLGHKIADEVVNKLVAQNWSPSGEGRQLSGNVGTFIPAHQSKGRIARA